MKRLAFITVALLVGAPARAQLTMANQLGVTMGHVHLVVKDVDAQKKFFIDTLGGTLVKNGPLELIHFRRIVSGRQTAYRATMDFEKYASPT